MESAAVAPPARSLAVVVVAPCFVVVVDTDFVPAAVARVPQLVAPLAVMVAVPASKEELQRFAMRFRCLF